MPGLWYNFYRTSSVYSERYVTENIHGHKIYYNRRLIYQSAHACNAVTSAENLNDLISIRIRSLRKF